MSDRFKIVYSIEKDLYTQGSPVIIRSGELCRDIKGGGMVCRFNFSSISDKTVKSLRLVLDLGEHIYDGMSVTRDTDFGAGVLIAVEDINVKSFTFFIDRVCFTDGSSWQGRDKSWLSVPKPVTPEQQLGDEALVREFRNKYGNDAVCFPYEAEDIWYCSCGALNHNTEAACHSCNKTLSDLKKYGVAELQKIVDKEKRLAAINKKAFDDAYRGVEEDRKARKSRSMLYILILAAVITIVAALIAADDDHYTQAVPRLESGYCDKL